MRYDRDEVIERQLRELARMPTVSAFSQGFYQLIADYACALGGGGEEVGGLFARFLNVELAYHGQLDRANRQEGLHLGDFQSAMDKRQIGLACLAEEVRATRAGSREDEIARQLILAECYYHTDQTDKVVAHLEAAAEDESEDPLIQFALGYNRFLLALQAFIRPTDKRGEWLTADYSHFQRTCLQAASAFEKALANGHDDAYLYHWLGMVLASAGLEQAAHEAFAQAEQAEGGGMAETDLQEEELWSTEAAETEHRVSELPAITPAEIARVREVLKNPLCISDLGLDNDQYMDN